MPRRHPPRERLHVNLTGLLSMAVIIGLVALAACAQCSGESSGCPPFPIANPYVR